MRSDFSLNSSRILLFLWVRSNFTKKYCLKKNQNAPRPSEHPPVMGKKCVVYYIQVIVEERFSDVYPNIEIL